jgi:uncharacterized damage-inducible protein DinB
MEERMDPRISAIRDSLNTNHAETAAMLKNLSADALKRRAANGWTVAQLAGHVAVAPSSAMYVLKRLSKGGNATVPSFLSWAPALRNWFSVRKYNSATTDDMLQTAGKARDEVIAWTDKIADGDLDRAGEVFGVGRKTVAEFLDYILEHGREHRAEITAALAN